jgi:rare lipoprotein A
MRSCAELFLAGLFAALPAVAAADYEQVGLASWYGDELRGRQTANGEPFNPDAMTAAHPKLPLGSFVDVTALDTGRTIRVRINDRGPYHGGRIIDVSFAAARALGMTGHGARPVRIVSVIQSDGDARAFREGRVSAMRPPAALSRLAAWRLRANWSAPVVPARVISGGTGPVWLQIASFSSASRATAMAVRFGATISKQGGIHRVRLGPYATVAQANAALAPLAAKGYPDAVIVR